MAKVSKRVAAFQAKVDRNKFYPIDEALSLVKEFATQAKDKGMHLDELQSYFDFFRHGVPPHGGFGMGLARVMMLMLEQSSIRETTFLFRGPNRLLP